MLSKPKSGWTIFQLPGTKPYSISYLDDIPFEWLEQAIHGLKTDLPFCVKGFLEPGRMLCTVSYENCHILIENNLYHPNVYQISSPVSMLNFCKTLYYDINDNIDDWISFYNTSGIIDNQEKEEFSRQRREKLKKLLTKLKALIEDEEKCFPYGRSFL